MRNLILLTLAALVHPLHAEDSAKTKYTAVVSGVVCQDCRATVTAAMKKLPGVAEVEFAKGEKPGLQKVSFAAASAKLTKEDAVKALGDHAKEFEIKSFSAVK